MSRALHNHVLGRRHLDTESLSSVQCAARGFCRRWRPCNGRGKEEGLTRVIASLAPECAYASWEISMHGRQFLPVQASYCTAVCVLLAHRKASIEAKGRTGGRVDRRVRKSDQTFICLTITEVGIHPAGDASRVPALLHQHNTNLDGCKSDGGTVQTSIEAKDSPRRAPPDSSRRCTRKGYSSRE